MNKCNAERRVRKLIRLYENSFFFIYVHKYACVYVDLLAVCCSAFILHSNISRWELEVGNCENVVEEQNAVFGIGVNAGRKTGSKLGL